MFETIALAVKNWEPAIIALHENLTINKNSLRDYRKKDTIILRTKLHYYQCFRETWLHLKL